MNRPSLRPVLWLLVLTCFALPMDGARSATPQADSSLMEMTNRLFELDLATVTGEALGTTEQDAMRNIRTIRAAEFAQLGAHSLRDLMRSQLNFDVSQDPILGSAMKMNGLGGRSVNVLVDGVPLTGRMNDNIDLSQITLDNVERIEIIDGPMAVEYGTNSLAGTINIITRTDITAASAMEATVQYESVGVQSQSVGLSSNRNGRHHSVHLSRYYFDGWSPSDANWDGFTDHLADSTRTQLWNPKLQHTLTWKTQYHVGNWLIKPRFNGMFERIDNKGEPRQPYGQTAFDDRYFTRRWMPTLEAKHYGADGNTWEAFVSYQRFWRSREAFATDLTNLETSPLEFESQDTTTMHSFQSRGSGDVWSLGMLKIRTGWDVNHQTLTSQRMSGATKTMSDAALFAQAFWESNRFRGQFGLRKAYNTQFAAPFLPSILGRWKNGPQRLRISYAKGFRAPSLKELHFRFVDVNHSLYGNENLAPETSHFTQLAYDWEDEHVAFSSQIFANYVRNQIGLVDQLDGTFRYQNFSQFQSQGLKLNGQIQLNRWQLHAASSWISSQQQIGEYEEAFPRFSAFECATRVEWSSRKSIHFGTSLRWIGPTQRVVSADLESIQQQSTEAYSWIDAHVEWADPDARWRLTATAKNITNVTAIVGSTNNAAHSPAANLMSWGRSFNLRVQYRIESRTP